MAKGKYIRKRGSLRIDIISGVPQLLESPLNHSIVKRARDKGLVYIEVHDIRDYATGKYRKIDDYSYGGSAGMVLMVEPIYKAITALTKQRKYDEVIFLSPDGEQFDQPMANTLSLKKNLILLCGHYKGIDHRIREHLITKEISIGNYVLSGGEIAAAAITDTLVRLIPGALTDETSALTDSYQNSLLSPPVYTRPANFKGWKVPDVLLSGDHNKISKWQDEQALARTKALRPELLK
ncbi:MAG: tRNA (guanosine(37)-N1)-methyltransferase TrmD [Bacteroidales bacterium]|nr:tRNA (guanosine(37)-N1)-methyltransferase TrmD [Bacteroidales bacterium]